MLECLGARAIAGFGLPCSLRRYIARVRDGGLALLRSAAFSPRPARRKPFVSPGVSCENCPGSTSSEKRARSAPRFDFFPREWPIFSNIRGSAVLAFNQRNSIPGLAASFHQPDCDGAVRIGGSSRGGPGLGSYLIPGAVIFQTFIRRPAAWRSSP